MLLIQNKEILKLLLVLCALLPLPAAAQSLSIYCEESAPYQIVKPDGSLTGLSYEVMQEIQKRIGNSDPIQLVPWNRAYTLALRQKNVILFSMVMTDERKPQFQWVGPVADTSLAFYAKKGSPLKIASHEDAKKVKAIAVYENDISQQTLEKLGYRNLVTSYNNDSSLKNLMMGRVDLVSIGRNAHRQYAENAGFKADDIQEVFVYLNSALYIAFSKGTDAAVVEKWNRAFSSMKRDGSFAAIFRKYFPNSPLPQ